MYLSTNFKFRLALVAALGWALFSWYIALPWVASLSTVIPAWLAWAIIFGIAIVPGFMNAFLVASLVADRRPQVRPDVTRCPPLTILVAAYNEEAGIASTIESIAKQHYPGKLSVIVVNDGSIDSTAEIVKSLQAQHKWLKLLTMTKNVGKANALTYALQFVKTSILITLDGDSYLYQNALKNIVGRYLSDPINTTAIAGAVLVRNSRKNFVTKIQEWDYFHGIAAIKRIQSLYQGTLVAQGAFSLYKTSAVKSAGGWPHTVGEDIVLTWALLKQGDRVGFAENAIAFTNVPDTWRQFIRQRQRWSRGLIEAFKEHSELLFCPRMTTMFIWWNLLFPYLDLVYTFAFIPGIILALFGVFWIAGPLTLIVLPLAMIVNYIMYRIQSRMFAEQGLRVRKNILGFFAYALCYSFILQPASVWGYAKEIINGTKKNWGTK